MRQKGGTQNARFDLALTDMNDAGSPITVAVHSAIAEIPGPAWDACAGDANPSVSYAFLSALEDSGSTTTRTGWTPQHLSLACP